MKQLIKYLSWFFILFIAFGVILLIPTYFMVSYITEVYKLNSIISFSYLILALYLLNKFNFWKMTREIKPTLSKGENNFLKVCTGLFFVFAVGYFVYSKKYLMSLLLVGIIPLLGYLKVSDKKEGKKPKGDTIYLS